MNKEDSQLHHLRYVSAIMIAVLILTVFLFVARSSAALSPQDIIDLKADTGRITKLADESQSQNQKCRRYMEGLQATASASHEKRYYTRETAAAVLNEAGAYNGTPLATTRALDQFLSLSSYPEGEELRTLRDSLNRLSDCSSSEYLGVLNKLIDRRTQASLTKSELRHERYLVLSYIQHESMYVPTLFSHVEGLAALFDRSIHEGLLVAQPETRVAVANLKWSIKKLKSEGASHFSDVDAQDSKSIIASLDGLTWQLSEAEELQDSLSDAAETELEILMEPQQNNSVLSYNQGI